MTNCLKNIKKIRKETRIKDIRVEYKPKKKCQIRDKFNEYELHLYKTNEFAFGDSVYEQRKTTSGFESFDPNLADNLTYRASNIFLCWETLASVLVYNLSYLVRSSVHISFLVKGISLLGWLTIFVNVLVLQITPIVLYECDSPLSLVTI